MKIWTYAILAPAMTVALLTGCSPVSVKFDYDANANYSALKTFDWYQGSPKAKGKADGVVNPIMDRRVRRIVAR